MDKIARVELSTQGRWRFSGKSSSASSKGEADIRRVGDGKLGVSCRTKGDFQAFWPTVRALV